MSSSYSYTPTKPKEPDKERPCSDCDLSGFDSANCEVEGTAAEADYMKQSQFQEKMKQRRAQFDTARTAYDKARGEVDGDLTLITDQLKLLRNKLECQINDERRRCLTDAWREVAKQLERCGGEQGCCVTEGQCTFEWTFEDPTPPAIRAKIEDFERRVTAAETCFDTILVKEPEELKKRVADLKAFVGKIAGNAADTKTTDYSSAFAELLWAEHRRWKVWLGFDTASAYMDCLCLALNCSLQGRRALAKLTGLLATLDCKDKRTTDRCTWLKANVVDEILAVCRRICPDRPAEDSAQSAS